MVVDGMQRKMFHVVATATDAGHFACGDVGSSSRSCSDVDVV